MAWNGWVIGAERGRIKLFCPTMAQEGLFRQKVLEGTGPAHPQGQLHKGEKQEAWELWHLGW